MVVNYVIVCARWLQHNVHNEVESKRHVYYSYVLDTRRVINL